MERKLTAVTQDVEARDVTRKRDGVKITLYNVTTDKGTFTASRRNVAETAYAHIGEEMEFTIDEVEKNGFTNYYLNKVEVPFNGSKTAMGSPPPERKSAFGVPQSTQPTLPQPTTEKPSKIPSGSGLSGIEKDINIMRQVCLKSMVHISATPDEFRTNCEAAMYWLMNGVWPNGSAPDTSGVGAPAPRQFIPEGAGGQQSESEYDADSDIPF